MPFFMKHFAFSSNAALFICTYALSSYFYAFFYFQCLPNLFPFFYGDMLFHAKFCLFFVNFAFFLGNAVLFHLSGFFCFSVPLSHHTFALFHNANALFYENVLFYFTYFSWNDLPFLATLPFSFLRVPFDLNFVPFSLLSVLLTSSCCPFFRCECPFSW